MSENNITIGDLMEIKKICKLSIVDAVPRIKTIQAKYGLSWEQMKKVIFVAQQMKDGE